jgi:ABC-type phosphate transport system auxiliary subunit
MILLPACSFIALALLAPFRASAAGSSVGDGGVQSTLNRMHEVNERGLIQGQQEGLKVKTQGLQNQESLDRSFSSQQEQDAQIPEIESKLSDIQVQQRALDAEKKQLSVTIPKPPQIKAQVPPATPNR